MGNNFYLCHYYTIISNDSSYGTVSLFNKGIQLINCNEFFLFFRKKKVLFAFSNNNLHINLFTLGDPEVDGCFYAAW